MDPLLNQYLDEIKYISVPEIHPDVLSNGNNVSIAGQIVTNPVWRFRVIELVVQENILTNTGMKSICSQIITHADRIGSLQRYIHAGRQMFELLKKKERISDAEVTTAQEAVVDTFDSFHPFLPPLSVEKREYVRKTLFLDEKDIEDSLTQENSNEIEADLEDAKSVGQKIVERYRKNATTTNSTSHIIDSDKAKIEFFLINADAPYSLDSSDMFAPAWVQKVLTSFHENVLQPTPDFLERMKLFEENYSSSPSSEEDNTDEEKNERIDRYRAYVRLYLVTSALASSMDVIQEIYKRLNP